MVLIHYNGEWIDNFIYKKFQVTGIQNQENYSYQRLIKAISKLLKIQNEEKTLEISYQVKEQYPALQIKDDSRLMFYIQLKATESDTTKYPLCITSNSKESNFYETTPTITKTSKHHSTSRKRSDTTSDILHYTTPNGKENNVNKENEVQSPLCLQLIISETNCKKIKQGQLYKDKQTLKTVMHFYAILKNFQF